MITIEKKITCPHYESDNINKCGKNTGKQCYIFQNQECKHKTFYSEYKYNTCKPSIKQNILNWSADGAGTRAISRQLKVHRDTVTSVLKKLKAG